MSNFKAGYRITVSSSENHGYHERINVKEGLSEIQAKFHIELLTLLTSVNGEGGYGNIHINDNNAVLDEYYRKCVNIANKPEYHGAIDVQYKAGKNLSAGIQWLLYEYVGVGPGDYHTRVVDDIKVEYLPHDITFDDVTSKFLNNYL